MPAWTLQLTTPKRPFTVLAVFALLSLLAAVLYGTRLKPPMAAYGDTPQYLVEAYHLRTHGTLSSAMTADPVPPGLGREPGYPVFLAALMAVDPGFSRFTPVCVTDPERCDDALYRVPQWANAGLIGAAGFTLCLAAWLLTGSRVAAAVAGGYLLLNVQMHKGWIYLASDHLAVWLLTLVMLATVWAARGGWARWALVGLALAALTFVKAIFLYFTLLAGFVALGALVIPSGARRRILLAGLALAVVYTAAVGGWILRNGLSTGHYAFTDQRSGIALSTREVFNRMTPQQYAAAFVFWTRGFGDGLARRLFPADVVDPFELGQPGGFYDVGQFGYGRRVAEIVASQGIDEDTATRQLDRSLMMAVLTHPVEHALTTLPLFYRGIWVDEFIVVGLPALVVALVVALRRRRWLTGALLGIGAFNLVFYALISLNISRYQMTAVPSLALATGLLAAEWARRRRGRAGGAGQAGRDPAHGPAYDW